MTEIIPIKSAYEIIKDVLGKGYDSLGFIFPDIPSSINARRTENLIRIMKSAQAKLDEAGLKPEERNAIALKLGLPIIEKASLEEDPTLQELWANLLANALNPEHSEKVKRIFIDIIQNLSPFDALILNSFTLSTHPLLTLSDNKVAVGTKDGYKDYPYDVVQTSINVLVALDLLTDVAPSKNFFAGENSILQQSEIHLTHLGVLFIDACIKGAFDNSAKASNGNEDIPEQ